MHLNEEKNTLFLEFKTKSARDIGVCLIFLENIFLLSNTFRNYLLTADKASKKFNKTQRIREGVEKLVNKQNFTKDTVNTLISVVRKGTIEKIETHLKGKLIIVSAREDFAQLLVDLS